MLLAFTAAWRTVTREKKKVWVGRMRNLWMSVVIGGFAATAILLPHDADAAGKRRARPSLNSAGFVKTRVAPQSLLTESDIAGNLALRSQAAMIVERDSGQILFAKNSAAVQPIASITKLMTAMVAIDSQAALEEPVRIETEDMDSLRGTRSRLRVGEVLRRSDLLRLALMASENSAAAALARANPAGLSAFIAAMNRKASELGMLDTRFADSTGLSSGNVSTAKDLVKMVETASNYALIREFSTTPSVMLTQLDTGREVEFRNTNMLVREDEWDISLSKTGYINASGQCLVMNATILGRPTVIVLLDSSGRLSRIHDAVRVKKWLEGNQRVLLSPRYES